MSGIHQETSSSSLLLSEQSDGERRRKAFRTERDEREREIGGLCLQKEFFFLTYSSGKKKREWGEISFCGLVLK